MSALKSGTARTTRLRKVSCDECGYNVRMSRSWLAVALPTCPNPDCAAVGLAMTCADPGDAVELGYLSLDDLPRTVRTDICRANGWEDQIIRTSPGRQARKAPAPRALAPMSKPQCENTGCGTWVAAGETHCRKHRASDMPF